VINKRNNYKLIAPYYQFISEIVFGKNLEQIQLDSFPWIPENGKILFIGGGSGSILKKLLQEKPRIEITYLDKSEEMISLSKRKLADKDLNSVEFICGEIESYHTAKKFDAVLSYFFLDQFAKKNRDLIIRQIETLLTPKGIIIIADFSPPKNTFQKLIEKLMFAFLKISTRIESDQIEDLNEEMNQYGYRRKEYLQHKKRNLFAAVYQKT
jgi:ubiquinone/menaquinone biosynthesis C-methylase UbiE